MQPEESTTLASGGVSAGDDPDSEWFYELLAEQRY